MSRRKGMTAEQWNARHPVGTPVLYWPFLPPVTDVPPVDSKTRSEAWALGGGHAVVLIEGKSGGVFLSHLDTDLAEVES